MTRDPGPPERRPETVGGGAAARAGEIGYGRHGGAGDAFCSVELAALLAGLDATDQPRGLSLVASRFLRTLNDGLDRETRQLLEPYAHRLSRTDASPAAEEARAGRVAEWLVHDCVAGWLRCAGEDEVAGPSAASPSEGGGPLLAAEESLVRTIRHVTALRGAEGGGRARRECEIQSRLLASGSAPAWVAYRDWSWARGCRYQMANDPALRVAWYSWLLCWRSLRLALARGRSTAATTTGIALQQSAFRLLDRILEQ